MDYKESQRSRISKLEAELRAKNTPKILINRLEADCPPISLLPTLVFYLKEYYDRPLKTLSHQTGCYAAFLSAMKWKASDSHFLELPKEFRNRITLPQEGDTLTGLIKAHYSAVVSHIKVHPFSPNTLGECFERVKEFLKEFSYSTDNVVGLLREHLKDYLDLVSAESFSRNLLYCLEKNGIASKNKNGSYVVKNRGLNSLSFHAYISFLRKKMERKVLPTTFHNIIQTTLGKFLQESE